MKKTISIIMVLFLIFSTISPFPFESADAEAGFQGNITGSTVGVDNLGTIKVKMNVIQGTTWSIRLLKEYGTFDQFDAYNGGEYEFKNVPPGAYKVEATAKDAQGSTAIQTSNIYYVKPKALTPQEINNNQPNQISVTLDNAMSGTLIRLYIDNNQVSPSNEGEKTIDNINKTVLFFVDARSNYRLTQVVNGAESDKSAFIKVIPQIPTLRVDSHAGPANNAGVITVSGTKDANKLILYRGGVAVYPQPIRVDSTTYTFENLSSGTYTVKQMENDVESKESNAVIINNEQSPLLTLNEPNKNNFSYTLKDGKIIAEPYVEHGISVSYRSIQAQSISKSGEKICEKIETDPRCITVTIEYKPLIDYDSDTGHLPGEYKVIYTATDDKEEKYTSSITRNVTIFPNATEIVSLNTKEYNDTKPIKEHTTGGIKVNKGILTMPTGLDYPTTLTLYQNPSGSNNLDGAILIKSETYVGEISHIFDNVPLGKGYFVVQTINGVSSKPSNWVTITDTTPPEMELNGNNPLTLEVGESYVEPGVTAIDNIESSDSLLRKVRVNYFAPSKEKPGSLTEISTINTNIPNEYTVKYNLTDEFGNHAKEVIRTVFIKPRAVTAIGSIATIGEVGAKNIFPGTPLQETHLQLWRYNTDNKQFEREGNVVRLNSSELTHVFKTYVHNGEVKPLPPGRYYVTQTVNGQISKPSNVVEILDIDRPYITLNGLEIIELVMDKELDPYYDSTNYIDPGATANDYLEAANLKLSATMIGPNKVQIGENLEVNGKDIKFPIIELKIPGTYTITYTAKAPRGSEADPKHRTIKLAPPKVKNIKAGKAGEGKIEMIDGLFKDESTITTVTLYNSYGQKMQSTIVNSKTHYFTSVPVGLGYYVTQTVNGIESAPSVSVNVSLHGEAQKTPLITSFEFSSLKAMGIIDQAASTITVTVPKGTDVTRLAPTIKGIFDGTSPIDGVIQNFTSPMTYEVFIKAEPLNISKKYTVIVTQEVADSTNWEDAVKRNVAIGASNSFTLSAIERLEAVNRGIHFISPQLSIYVPAANVKESSLPTLIIEQPTINEIVTSSDPTWAKDISNQLQIGWGTETSFYQPIEVALKQSSEKVFAKLVRNANNQLYAVAQPSYSVNTTEIIGLASEPGLYALIDDVAKPYIQDLGLGNFQIHSLTTGANIYYTTNSQYISYGKPATSTSGNFTLTGSNINLNGWQLYLPGEILSIPKNELYAVAVKNQVISPISSFQPNTFTTWGTSVKQVTADHIWKVSFNAEVDKKAIYNNSIYVIDETTGAVVPTTLTLGADGQSIHITPNMQYEKNRHYTLWVTKQIKGNTITNQFLAQPIKMPFTIK